MPIELSAITFTEQGDFVGLSDEGEIRNVFANTLAGNDVIIGNSENSYTDNSIFSNGKRISGIYNSGVFNTGDGNDLIIGTGEPTDLVFGNLLNNISGIRNIGTLNTGDGNDSILGFRVYKTDPTLSNDVFGYGIYNQEGTIATGNGDDIITGISEVLKATGICLDTRNGHSDENKTSINTGNGNDTITGIGNLYGIGIYSTGEHNGASIDTGNDNDIITGIGQQFGINIGFKSGIDTRNGDDIITGNGIIGINIGFSSYINTGDGNDTITTINFTQGMKNNGTINTNDGDDDIISEFITNSGIIDTGNGNDSLISYRGFSGKGDIFLGDGTDYLKGFGSGRFNGKDGEDTLELISGSYTIEILETAVNFTTNSGPSNIPVTMETFEFEKLIAGSTIYDFISLTAGQIIVVA
jgi:Ca2+-binding RTX toxin-like protein